MSGEDSTRTTPETLSRDSLGDSLWRRGEGAGQGPLLRAHVKGSRSAKLSHCPLVLTRLLYHPAPSKTKSTFPAPPTKTSTLFLKLSRLDSTRDDPWGLGVPLGTPVKSSMFEK